MLQIKAQTADGRIAAVELTQDRPHVHTEFTPTNTEDDIVRMVIAPTGAEVDEIEIEFEPRCVPEHPFYVRWINKDGGYNYQMFENRSWLTRSIEDIKTYRPFLASTPDARSTDRLVNFTPTESVEAGVEGLSYGDALELSNLLYSPRIDWYDRELGIWKEIVFDGNQSLELDRKQIMFTVEFKFKLPTRSIQL